MRINLFNLENFIVRKVELLFSKNDNFCFGTGVLKPNDVAHRDKDQSICLSKSTYSRLMVYLDPSRCIIITGKGYTRKHTNTDMLDKKHLIKKSVSCAADSPGPPHRKPQGGGQAPSDSPPSSPGEAIQGRPPTANRRG